MTSNTSALLVIWFAFGLLTPATALRPTHDQGLGQKEFQSAAAGGASARVVTKAGGGLAQVSSSYHLDTWKGYCHGHNFEVSCMGGDAKCLLTIKKATFPVRGVQAPKHEKMNTVLTTMRAKNKMKKLIKKGEKLPAIPEAQEEDHRDAEEDEYEAPLSGSGDDAKENPAYMEKVRGGANSFVKFFSTAVTDEEEEEREEEPRRLEALNDARRGEGLFMFFRTWESSARLEDFADPPDLKEALASAWPRLWLRFAKGRLCVFFDKKAPALNAGRRLEKREAAAASSKAEEASVAESTNSTSTKKRISKLRKKMASSTGKALKKTAAKTKSAIDVGVAATGSSVRTIDVCAGCKCKLAKQDSVRSSRDLPFHRAQKQDSVSSGLV